MSQVRLAALVLLAGAVPAMAADLPTRKQAQPPVFAAPAANSGFYVGAFAGGVFGGLTTNPGDASRAAGFTTGTLAGYKWRLSPWTFGLEGDIATNSLTQKFRGVGLAPPTQIDNVYAIHARARLGYQLGNFEPFIAGGFALTEIAQSRQSPAEFIGASSLRPGWTIGGGVEASFDAPLIGPTTLRAEYLYDRLAPTDLNLGGIVYRTGGAEHYARVALINYLNSAAAPAGPEVVANWNGSYFGVLGGLNEARYSTAAGRIDAKGGSIGVYTGRNWTFGQGAMLGLEGSTSFSSINGDGPQPFAASTHIHDYLISDLRGRAGWAFGRWLPYAAAGVAFDTSSQSDRANGNYRGAIVHTSATIGAGLDYMLTDRFALRGEYAYRRSIRSVTTKLEPAPCCSQSLEGQSVRFGLSYFLR